MRITRGNDPLNLTIYPNFRLRMLRFSEWLEVHNLASKKSSKLIDLVLQSLKSKFLWVLNQAKNLGLPPPPALATLGMTAEDKKRKRNETLKEVFFKDQIDVDGIQRNITPPFGVVGKECMVIREPKVGFFYSNAIFDLVFQRESEFYITSTVKLIRPLKHINLDSPEAREMYKIMEIEIESMDDVNKEKEIVRTNSDGLVICIKDKLSVKHQLAVKGLSECRALESNIRRIQVKDIVKEVEDYLKTYSSAVMDISWLSKRLCIKSKHNQLVFATIFVTLMNVTYAIRVRELCSWTPTFVEIDSDREDKEMQSKDAEEANVPGLDHEPQQHDLDSDPFGLEPLINKKVGTEAASQSSVTFMFPPGFSPLPDEDIASLWIPNNVRIMWIAVYAPQALQDKIALWSSISNLTRNWDGILIALGDFNMRVIRDWIATKKHESTKLKQEHVLRLATIDAKIDKGIANDLDFKNRRESIKVLGDVDRLEASDLAQKARIKWAMEGDENTSFFHAMLKKHRSQLAIKGIMNNGAWIEDPDCVKAVFNDHFCKRFQKDYAPHHPFDIDMPKQLSSDQRAFLDRDISREEIKKAVWDCGGDHAPVQMALIPKVSNATLVTDFCPISLIGRQYKIIGKILANRLGLVISSCISPEQSDFIKGRNILDGPLILNEVMNWYQKLGFGSRWRIWIKGCFVNARSSILVNGSPTTEFFVSKGLRQGDPLSPFLFILAMKGLHALVCKAINVGIFKGASVGNEHLRVSHLIYANDVIFVGQCLLGTCVSEEEVSDMASIIGCGAATFPLTYLGVPVGCRLTLLKSVLGNLPTYFMALYHMPVSIRSKLESLRSNFFLGSDLGGISDSRVHGSNQSPWRGILFMVKSIKLKGVDLLSLCHRKLGCNVANRLSLPDWGSVQRRNPRGGIEASQFKVLRLLIEPVVLNSHQDTWTWSLGVLKGYTVASVRSLIDLHFLGANLNATHWNRSMPVKVNVFMWRAMLNKLPTRVNLDRKGIEVDSLLCPIYHEDVETVNHIFFTCDLAKVLWALLAKWWELDVPFCASISDCLSWLDSSSISSKARVFLDSVRAALMWFLWSFRNRLLFSTPPPKKSLIWDSIVSYSFLWISSRNP
nr:hypothetical protein [Tanacetum cinerariifolium]